MAKPRTQCSIAATADGMRWVLFNAAPELAAQIAATPALHPRPTAGEVRHSPIAAVVLTGGEIDAIAGLLSLRERHAFALHGTSRTLDVLDANPMFRALDPALVPRRPLAPGGTSMLCDAAGRGLGMSVEAFAVPGKVPLFLEGAQDPGHLSDSETIGLVIRGAAGGEAFFVPGCAAMTNALRDRLRGASLVLFDGTLWRDDEMIQAGAGAKTGARMGHMSIDGPNGVLEAFADLGVRRRVLVHLNNTNPVLLADSAERAAVTAAGWEVAEDGMEIVA